MRAVTIYEVAKHAEVSAKTVSRVLNDEPNVRPELRERVRASAEALGYSPNLFARSLRGSSSQLIVALADASLTLDHLRSEFGSNYLDRFQLGAMMRCREQDFHLMIELVEIGQPDTRRKLLGLLTAFKPDGVILTPPNSDDAEVLDVLEQTGTPYVRLGPELDLERGPRVYMDDFDAAYRMTRYLIELGHREIGFIVGSTRYPVAQLRLDGFHKAMGESGLTAPPARICQGDFTFALGHSCGEALLGGADRPTAIFASNDEMALGVLHAAAKLGLTAPRDLSVVGFDDIGSARFSIPPLTTVRQPVAEMSLAAADMLINRAVSKEPLAMPAETLAAFELVVRASAAPPGE